MGVGEVIVVDDPRGVVAGLAGGEVVTLALDVAMVRRSRGVGVPVPAVRTARDRNTELDFHEHREVPLVTQFGAMHGDPIEHEYFHIVRGLNDRRDWLFGMHVVDAPNDPTVASVRQGVEQQTTQRAVVVGVQAEPFR